MPFLAPEMQQVLAGILAAILWTYFQGGRMCFKKMKSDKIQLLRSECYILLTSEEKKKERKEMMIKKNLKKKIGRSFSIRLRFLTDTLFFFTIGFYDSALDLPYTRILPTRLS